MITGGSLGSTSITRSQLASLASSREEEAKQRTGKKGGCGSSGARPAAGGGGGLVQLTAEEDDQECRQESYCTGPACLDQGNGNGPLSNPIGSHLYTALACKRSSRWSKLLLMFGGHF